VRDYSKLVCNTVLFSISHFYLRSLPSEPATPDLSLFRPLRYPARINLPFKRS